MSILDTSFYMAPRIPTMTRNMMKGLRALDLLLVFELIYALKKDSKNTVEITPEFLEELSTTLEYSVGSIQNAIGRLKKHNILHKVKGYTFLINPVIVMSSQRKQMQELIDQGYFDVFGDSIDELKSNV